MPGEVGAIQRPNNGPVRVPAVPPGRAPESVRQDKPSGAPVSAQRSPSAGTRPCPQPECREERQKKQGHPTMSRCPAARAAIFAVHAERRASATSARRKRIHPARVRPTARGGITSAESSKSDRSRIPGGRPRGLPLRPFFHGVRFSRRPRRGGRRGNSSRGSIAAANASPSLAHCYTH
jgi:hypothetical protein